MNYENFYRDLETKSAQELSACMQGVVGVARRRASADHQFFANTATPSQAIALVNADKNARELKKCQIALKLWTHQAVWSKYSAAGSPQPSPSDLVKATSSLIAQPRVSAFIASVNMAVDNELKHKKVEAAKDKEMQPSMDRSSGGFDGSEEHKQSSTPMLISNPTSTPRDPRLDDSRPGCVVYPPSLNVPLQNGPPKHTAEQWEIDQHKERINAIAEQNKQRRANEHHAGQQPVSHSSSFAPRQTLPMPSAVPNGPRVPYAQDRSFTSPPRNSYSGGGGSSSYSNGHTSSPYGPASGASNGTSNGTYSNGNGKRPYDSAGPSSYGRGGGRDGGRGGRGFGGGGGRGFAMSPGRPRAGRF